MAGAVAVHWLKWSPRCLSCDLTRFQLLREHFPQPPFSCHNLPGSPWPQGVPTSAFRRDSPFVPGARSSTTAVSSAPTNTISAA